MLSSMPLFVSGFQARLVCQIIAKPPGAAWSPLLSWSSGIFSRSSVLFLIGDSNSSSYTNTLTNRLPAQPGSMTVLLI